jgi:hypothetical protein
MSPSSSGSLSLEYILELKCNGASAWFFPFERVSYTSQYTSTSHQAHVVEYMIMGICQSGRGLKHLTIETCKDVRREHGLVPLVNNWVTQADGDWISLWRIPTEALCRYELSKFFLHFILWKMGDFYDTWTSTNNFSYVIETATTFSQTFPIRKKEEKKNKSRGLVNSSYWSDLCERKHIRNWRNPSSCLPGAGIFHSTQYEESLKKIMVDHSFVITIEFYATGT